MPGSNQSSTQPTFSNEGTLNTPYDLYKSIVWGILYHKFPLSTLGDDQFEIVQKVADTAITAALIAAHIPNNWDLVTAHVAAQLTEMEQQS